MRRVASAPPGKLRVGSLLPLQRRVSERKERPERWARLSRAAPRLCGFLIVLLVIGRTLVLPQAVRSERSEHPAVFREDAISCPSWYDRTGNANIKTPQGPWTVPKHETPQVFLYAIIGSNLEATRLAGHFLDFYVRRAGIKREHVHITLHASHEDDEYTQALRTLLEKEQVHYDLWVGTFTSETKAWHRDELTQKTLGRDDWLVVADVDELHQFPGVTSASTSEAPVDAFLAAVAERGANFVSAAWEDRVAEGGHLNHVKPDVPLERQFPLRCRMAEWTVPEKTSLISMWLPKAEDHKVVASRAYLKVHRSAHKIRWASYFEAVLRYVTFGFRGIPWPTTYVPRSHGGPLTGVVKSQHYKWIAGLVPYLDRRVRVYEKCGLLWSYESAAIVDRLETYGGRVCVTCGELACAHASPVERRRVAIVTSVWDEHIDGVSITMNRVATYLEQSPLEDVLVLTPHDPTVPTPVMPGLDRIPKFSTGSVPVFALIGRNDYVMGSPLGKAEGDVLTAYNPDVVHLVSPDLLGFSAQKWARANNVCRVCTYHTQIDRYVRFYTAKHSLLDKLRPRIAVQKLFSTFYGGCDVVAVPNSAIADKLVLKMGIPRAKIGLFPRGVNASQYNPGKRSVALRAKFGADNSNVVVLWAARLVPEKGADLFADAFVALFNNKTLLDHYPGVIDRIRIVVVGSGPSRAKMEAELPPDRTVFYGHLVGEELRAAYASSDIYFFPSHTEAFPNTLLEAQASGLAVLAPAYSVNRALVPAGSGHLVSEHAGPEEFADGLFTLLRDLIYRRAIGRRAVVVARNRTWAKAFAELTDCYDRCKALGRR